MLRGHRHCRADRLSAPRRQLHCGGQAERARSEGALCPSLCLLAQSLSVRLHRPTAELPTAKKSPRVRTAGQRRSRPTSRRIGGRFDLIDRIEIPRLAKCGRRGHIVTGFRVHLMSDYSAHMPVPHRLMWTNNLSVFSIRKAAQIRSRDRVEDVRSAGFSVSW